MSLERKRLLAQLEQLDQREEREKRDAREARSRSRRRREAPERTRRARSPGRARSPEETRRPRPSTSSYRPPREPEYEPRAETQNLEPIWEKITAMDHKIHEQDREIRDQRRRLDEMACGICGKHHGCSPCWYQGQKGRGIKGAPEKKGRGIKGAPEPGKGEQKGRDVKGPPEPRELQDCATKQSEHIVVYNYDDDKPYKCLACGNEYAEAYMLWQHTSDNQFHNRSLEIARATDFEEGSGRIAIAQPLDMTRFEEAVIAKKHREEERWKSVR